MPFNKSHVKYILDQFDAGVSPHQILLNLQYRDFLPSITVATIERCIRDNGRVLPDQQTGDATQGNQLRQAGLQASPPQLPAASQSPADSTMATQGSVNSPLASIPDTSNLDTTREPFQESNLSSLGFTTETFPTTVEQIGDTAPCRHWDTWADGYVLAAFCVHKSGEETFRELRKRGYNISRLQIVDSLVRQNLCAKEMKFRPIRHN